MKKTSEEWNRHLPAGEVGAHLFPEFEKRAKAAATEVFRVKTPLEAAELVLTLAGQAGARKVVSTESPLLDEAGLKGAFTAAGIEFYNDQAGNRSARPGISKLPKRSPCSTSRHLMPNRPM